MGESTDGNGSTAEAAAAEFSSVGGRPNPAQRRYLKRGLTQAGGKLPLFDENGKRVSERTVRSCLEKGWIEPWFGNPMKPDWLICKLTAAGRRVLGEPEEEGR